MKGLAGRVAVVAGAGGIGAACALRLAAEGARVVVGDQDVDGARDVVERIRSAGGDARAVGFDITDEDSVQELFATTQAHFGAAELLHANAAAMAPEDFYPDVDALAAPLAVFDHVMQVNLRGFLLCTRAALPAMIDAHYGSIVYTASTAAVIPSTKAFYAASKAGVLTLMRHVALRWGKRGIRANAVAPGFILTPSARSKESDESIGRHLAALPHTRIGTVEDISSTVAFLLSEEAAYLQGQVVHVNGGHYMP